MKPLLLAVVVSSKLVFSSLSVAAQVSNQSTGLPVDKFVTVAGQKMHYQIAGAGKATVVFECGHGADLSSWNPIFPEVAKFAKAVSYDRAGYGSSETNTQLKSFKEIATRLHELLEKANIKPPYILVGHSLGGALIRAYAYLYPAETAGLVFVDPLTEYIADGFSKEQKLQITQSMDSTMTNAPATYVAEWEIIKNDFLNGFPEIHSFGACPDVPLVMLVAGKNRTPTWENSVRNLYENKMKALSETRIIEIGQSPHHIQRYEPSLVIENIRRVVFPDAENVLRKTLKAKGIDSCIAEYKKIKMSYPKEYMLERFLNTLGYEELKRGQIPAAIKLFALNVEAYPKSSNVYDSLGEAYMVAGNKKEATKNYEKSLALNPDNRNATKMLEKLR